MTLADRFSKFHQNNPHVYELFKRFCFEAIGLGRNKLSAEMLVHRIRWEGVIYPLSDDGYKINNNFAAFYGRMFAKEFPEHRHFFRTRASVADRLAAA